MKNILLILAVCSICINKCSDDNKTIVYDNICEIKIIYDIDFASAYIIGAPCELFEQRRTTNTLRINDTKQIASIYSALQEEKDTLNDSHVDTSAKLFIYYTDGTVDETCMSITQKVSINGIAYWMKNDDFYHVICRIIKFYHKDFSYYDYQKGKYR
jgi:hypothetical protein